MISSVRFSVWLRAFFPFFSFSSSEYNDRFFRDNSQHLQYPKASVTRQRVDHRGDKPVLRGKDMAVRCWTDVLGFVTGV